MDSNGNHMGGLVGTLRSLKCLLRDFSPSKVIVVWDGEGGSAKRRGIFAEYKAGRKPRVNREYDFAETGAESLADIQRQYVRTKSYMDALGLLQVEVEGVEADDVIAHIWRTYQGESKLIVSSDKDFLQLVDEMTTVYSPTRKVMYDRGKVLSTFSVIPENFIYFKALVGDGSDNIKGVRGIGEKTVGKLFPFLAERESSVDEIVTYAAERKGEGKRYALVAESRDRLIENVSLMQLRTPIIGPDSIRAIRYSLDKVPEASFTQLKMLLVRDGVQITDADFFAVFRANTLRTMADRAGGDKR